MEHIETIIVGGGQAGLATSYYLKERGREHVVLEKSEQPASSWRDRSWDSFTLVTPNWAFRMPGAKSDSGSHDGFMHRNQVIQFFEYMVGEFKLPVKYKSQVTSIAPSDHNGYLVQTHGKDYKAKNVIIATGFLQHPRIPAFAGNISPDIRQLHSSSYRNPEMLPPGNLLIAGSGQSGSQIAEELCHAGRKVYLSTGRAGRVPRSYRGKDIFEWLELTGFLNLTPEQLPPGMGKFDGIPQLSGKEGHSINLHQFVRDGVILLGHLIGAEGHRVAIAPDLHKNLEIMDQFESDVAEIIDGYILEHGLACPAENLPQLRDGYEQHVLEELDLKKEGITAIIWAVGYTFDYSLVQLPVLDEDGFPVQSNGVTNYPGLYFVGLPWMPSEKSGFLIGVAESARQIASSIM
ncbi:MAG TPA: NAD(P)/FAD-dependent oxidoreductase [Cyclobacteriaceae bacterium]